MHAYGFEAADDFDRVLLAGLESGYFDPGPIKATASTVHNGLVSQEKQLPFDAAWRLYRDSFEDNEEHILDRLIDSIEVDLDLISPVNLIGTVRLLKDFGRDTDAAEIIQRYVNTPRRAARILRPRRGPIREHVDDPDVRAAFKGKLEAFNDARSVADVLLAISEKSCWAAEDLRTLATAPPTEYVAAIQSGAGSRVEEAHLRELAIRQNRQRL